MLLILSFLLLSGVFLFWSKTFAQTTPSSPTNSQTDLWGSTPIVFPTSTTSPPATPSTTNYTTNTTSTSSTSNSQVQVDSSICASPQWAKRNSVTGICSCPSGMTNVDDTCTLCNAPGVCCGVKLNTSIPFIGSCIESSGAYVSPGGDEIAVSWEGAFPTLIGSLTKILVSVILITSFILIVVAGVMIASGKASEGKKMITNVVIGLALLWASGVILHLINPNFFG